MQKKAYPALIISLLLVAATSGSLMVGVYANLQGFYLIELTEHEEPTQESGKLKKLTDLEDSSQPPDSFFSFHPDSLSGKARRLRAPSVFSLNHPEILSPPPEQR